MTATLPAPPPLTRRQVLAGGPALWQAVPAFVNHGPALDDLATRLG